MPGQYIEDLGEERAVGRAVARVALEELAARGVQERENERVRLGQVERPLDGVLRGSRLAERAAGQGVKAPVTRFGRRAVTRGPATLGDMNQASAALFYEIRVRGVLGETLLTAFPALSTHAHDGVTALSGYLPDQAALHGVLRQVESLGLELLNVHRVAAAARHSRHV